MLTRVIHHELTCMIAHMHPLHSDTCGICTPPNSCKQIAKYTVCQSVCVYVCLSQTGAAYLPVDSHSAINRVRYTLHEAAPLCIVVDGKSEFKRDTDTVWSSFLLLDLTELVAAAVAGDVR